MPPRSAVALAVLGLLLAAPLAAAPRAWTRTATPDGEVLSAPWKDAQGTEHPLVATFPPDTLATARVLRFGLADVMATLGERMRAWAAREAPGLVVTVRGTTMTLEAGGASAEEVDRVLAAARAEKQRLYAALLAERHLVRSGPEELRYDHARIAAESAPLVRPVALALGAGDGAAADDLRAYAARALLFVQGIPYEAVTRDTFAPPLAVLRDPRADCDEKAVLYAALLRAAAPTLPVAIVTMDQHAFVAVGLPAREHERALTVDGTAWLVAEPAGPALHALGVLDSRTSAALARGITLTRVP